MNSFWSSPRTELILIQSYNWINILHQVSTIIMLSKIKRHVWLIYSRIINEFEIDICCISIWYFLFKFQFTFFYQFTKRILKASHITDISIIFRQLNHNENSKNCKYNFLDHFSICCTQVCFRRGYKALFAWPSYRYNC